MIYTNCQAIANYREEGKVCMQCSGVGMWISDLAALPVCMLLSRIQILFPAADSRRWHCEAAVAQMPMSPGRIMLDASLFLDDG